MLDEPKSDIVESYHPMPLKGESAANKPTLGGSEGTIPEKDSSGPERVIS